jgi:poly-gamma-glutamate synthesis protein (capsule biosynthesis protein)
LAFLGDVMLGRGVTPGEDSLAYLAPYLQSADLALANLESPLTTIPLQTSGYNLCASPDRVRFLAEAGLDLLSLANNHSLDCGLDGLAETESTLHAAGLTALGSADEPVYRTINDLRLAFLAFEDVSAPLDGEAAVQLIRGAHDTSALVIVSIHWGVEYQGSASERQRQLAQQFVDAGAILIWGHHPHVLQPAKWIGPEPCEGSDPAAAPQDRPSQGCTLVLYSLGNALFDQGGLADTRQSALVLVELDEDGVRSVHAIPFEIDIQHSRVMEADEQVTQAILELLGLSKKVLWDLP